MAYCDRCQRHFPTNRALLQHEDNSGAHYICYECDVDFDSWTALKAHWVQSPIHSYCQYCGQHFDDLCLLKGHFREVHHFCESCNTVFKTERGLEEHNKQAPAHFYCSECKRYFSSKNNLSYHMSSSAHHPKDVPCPCVYCKQVFVSRSALVLHLEAGCCPSGATLSMVNHAIRQLDATNVITDPERLLGNGKHVEQVLYCASGASFNGYGYECYLCHNEYRTLRGLNQHLASPRHQRKVYICPMNDCRSRFGTLSALWQHVESEKCGVAKFQKVQRAMDRIVSGVARIAS